MTDADVPSSQKPEPTADNGRSPPPLGWLTRLKTRLGFQEEPSLREVLEEAISRQKEQGDDFAPQQREMLLRTIRFGELRVDDVMVPRADVIAIEDSATIAEALEEFRQAGHSRLPIYHETLDDLKGMVHIKDLMSWLLEQAGSPAVRRLAALRPDLSGLDLTRTLASAGIARKVLFVPGSMPALNLFLRMQTTHIHLAMVVDEYGGTDGLVSIEDLVEQIMGEIEDEHDDDDGDNLIEATPQGVVASGRTPIADLEEHLGLALTSPEDDEDFDTLGGLLFTLLGRVPSRGEHIRHASGIEFEVLEADPRRVKKVRIHRPATAQDVETEDASTTDRTG